MSGRPRRTQAERRASTRSALLEACVDCLLERGYAGLTTGEVVRRAGVSRGAQAHHFSTKAELVMAALRHVTERLGAELVTEPLPPGLSPDRVRLALLDQLWAMHQDRAFSALMELWLAARTDAELRGALSGFEGELTHRTVQFCQKLAPELADRPDFQTYLVTVLAALRGLAILEFLERGEEIDRIWPSVRARLLLLSDGPGDVHIS
ncbi:MAG TPA: TetR/AcrR family transcriptional regulator [Pseudonocardia sp.]